MVAYQHRRTVGARPDCSHDRAELGIVVGQTIVEQAPLSLR
jgi:hypothetical protein